MQNGNHENCVFYACIYSQLDKHVSWLATSAINDDRHCWSGRGRRWFGRTASAASKALNESRPWCLRHLMCLVLLDPRHFGTSAELSVRHIGTNRQYRSVWTDSHQNFTNINRRHRKCYFPSVRMEIKC